jgi:hypothetical protein
VKLPLQPGKSIGLYVTLQILTLAFCWAWFGVLWTMASFGFNFDDIEWWILVIAACAGIWGLRPNLERAIDTAWLQGVTNSTALAERAAQLRPLKRRIEIYFSLAVGLILIAGIVLWMLGVINLGNEVAIQ